MKSKWLLAAALAVSANALAGSPGQVLQDYAVQARQEDPAFMGFLSARGEALFRARSQGNSGEKTGCTDCHTDNPTNPGKTRANKEIAPLAPSANPRRFADPTKTEKWFRRNCQDVLGRVCTAREKGDFITYLLSAK